MVYLEMKCPQSASLIRNQKAIELSRQYPEISQLTETERSILELIAKNETSREIAAELFISHRTVQNHRTHMCEKLDFKGYHKLLQFALENKS